MPLVKEAAVPLVKEAAVPLVEEAAVPLVEEAAVPLVEEAAVPLVRIDFVEGRPPDVTKELRARVDEVEEPRHSAVGE